MSDSATDTDRVTIEILLVEDNPGDVELTREAFIESRLSNHINVARDGVEALEYLRRKGVHANAVRPDIVLLDLNLPRKGGLEVLAELKADPSSGTLSSQICPPWRSTRR